MTPDITIAGTGIVSVDQLTFEIDRAVRASREVLLADTGVATRSWMEARCPVVTDLFGGSYLADRPRLDTYAHMAARVVDAAMRNPPVTFAIHGHPLVFSHPPFLVMELASLLGLTFCVLPGISATAALLCDLRLDPCVDGLQMYEATDLLVRKRPLQTDVALLIWQVGAVETRLYSPLPSRPERFVRLRDHLLRFYPADHRGLAVYSSPHPLVRSMAVPLTVGGLCEVAEHLHIGHTLYLPPVARRPVLDHDLFRAIDDPEHLRRITRT